MVESIEIDSTVINEISAIQHQQQRKKERMVGTPPVYPSYDVLPIGDFQYDLCGSCTERSILCRSSLWWNAFICQCIPIIQLLNRFHWNVYASRTNYSRTVTCFVALSVYSIAITCVFIFSNFFTFCDDKINENAVNDDLIYNFEEDEDHPSLCFIPTTPIAIFSILSLGIVCYILLFILLVRTRSQYRYYYNIEGNYVADCCTMWCCTCCASIQMLRQTHDESIYPYTCCNCLTGLPTNAPEIV